MAGIFRFFSAILEKVANFAKWLLAVFKQVFADLWNIITDLGCWGFDALLGIAIGTLNAIAIPFDPSTYYAMIPADAANMLGLVKIPQAIAIIVAALVIRFALQTIPFVRWGS